MSCKRVFMILEKPFVQGKFSSLVMTLDPLGQSFCSIVWSSISLDEIKQPVRFFAWRYSSKNKSIWEYHFRLPVASCASGSVSLNDSLIINICGKNKVILIFFFFYMEEVIKARWHLRLPLFGWFWRLWLYPIRLENYLINNKTGKNQFTSLMFCIEIIIKCGSI